MHEYHYKMRPLSIPLVVKLYVSEVVILCFLLASPLQLTLTAYRGPGIPWFLAFYYQYTRVVCMQKAKELALLLSFFEKRSIFLCCTNIRIMFTCINSLEDINYWVFLLELRVYELIWCKKYMVLEGTQCTEGTVHGTPHQQAHG